MPKAKLLKSEYSNAYKIYQEMADAEYSSNLKLRLARRSHEVSHQPWAWVEESSSEEELVNNQKKCHCPSTDIKDESIQVSNGYASDDTNSNFDASGAVDLNNSNNQGDIIEKLKQKALERAAELRKSQQNMRKTVNQPEQIIQLTNDQSPSAYRRPQHPIKNNGKSINQSIKTPKPSDQEPVKSAKTLANIRRIDNNNRNNNNISRTTSCGSSNSHFVPYGLGSGTDENYHKKTFNVSADCDVYPSALRAFHKREQDRLQRIKQRQRQVQQKQSDQMTNHPSKVIGCDDSDAKADISSARSNRKHQYTRRQSTPASKDWMSEYQSRYPIYDNEIYRRCRANIALHHSRNDTPPSTCRI